MLAMADAVAVFFDDEADQAVRALWRRLGGASVPSLLKHQLGKVPPHVTFAVAKSIPAKTRSLLRTELSRLSIPNLWLSTLGTFPTTDNVLMLSAVVDAELLAVHSAMHDVLAGRVQGPSAYHLPGSWIPHCTLAQGIEYEEIVAGFAALHPVHRIEAQVRQIAVIDTRTAELDVLRDHVGSG